jgi:putative peptidoglycan lipid II flippase
VLLLMLRAQIVRVVLGGEAFDWKATVLAFQTLQWFAVSLFAQSLIPLFVRSLYALGSAAKPLLSSAAALVVAVIGYFLFARSLGVAGLALAASLGFLIQCAMLYGMLQYRVQAFEDGALLGSLARLLLASFVMAGWIQFMKAPVASIFGTSTFFGVAAQAAVAGFVGCFVYVLLCKLLGSPELQTVIAGARRRLVRQAPVPRETVS